MASFAPLPATPIPWTTVPPGYAYGSVYSLHVFNSSFNLCCEMSPIQWFLNQARSYGSIRGQFPPKLYCFQVILCYTYNENKNIAP